MAGMSDQAIRREYREGDVRDVRLSSGRLDLTVESAPADAVALWGAKVVGVSVTWRAPGGRGHAGPIDLDAVRARFQLAQLAGQDADDAGNGWDAAKLGAITRLWQDVARLTDELQRWRERFGAQDRP
jgi:hypothetical protein